MYKIVEKEKMSPTITMLKLYTPEIAKKVRDVTDRELTIGGEMELAISFSPYLVLKEIKFQNAAWGSRPELFTVKRLEIRVSLVPLLFKNIKVDRLMVVEPDILIETDRSGRSNLVFETKKGPTAQREGEKASSEETTI